MRANEEQGGNAVQRQYGGFVAEGIGQVPRMQLSVPRYLFAVVGHDPTSGGLRSFPLSSHYLSISASHSPSPSPVLSPFSLLSLSPLLLTLPFLLSLSSSSVLSLPLLQPILLLMPLALRLLLSLAGTHLFSLLFSLSIYCSHTLTLPLPPHFSLLTVLLYFCPPYS